MGRRRRGQDAPGPAHALAVRKVDRVEVVDVEQVGPPVGLARVNRTAGQAAEVGALVEIRHEPRVEPEDDHVERGQPEPTKQVHLPEREPPEERTDAVNAERVQLLEHAVRDEEPGEEEECVD